jgi:hypothetical protein
MFPGAACIGALTANATKPSINPLELQRPFIGRGNMTFSGSQHTVRAFVFKKSSRLETNIMLAAKSAGCLLSEASQIFYRHVLFTPLCLKLFCPNSNAIKKSIPRDQTKRQRQSFVQRRYTRYAVAAGAA